MIGINNQYELEQLVEKAGGKIVWPKRRYHYLIFGSYVKEPVGCCWDRFDVLLEEPDSTFKRIAKNKCPICNEIPA